MCPTKLSTLPLCPLLQCRQLLPLSSRRRHISLLQRRSLPLQSKIRHQLKSSRQYRRHRWRRTNLSLRRLQPNLNPPPYPYNRNLWLKLNQSQWRLHQRLQLHKQELAVEQLEVQQIRVLLEGLPQAKELEEEPLLLPDEVVPPLGVVAPLLGEEVPLPDEGERLQGRRQVEARLQRVAVLRPPAAQPQRPEEVEPQRPEEVLLLRAVELRRQLVEAHQRPEGEGALREHPSRNHSRGNNQKIL